MSFIFWHEIELESGEVKTVEITYNISGEHYAATLIDPEENPECEVEQVLYQGHRLDFDRDHIEHLCWEHYYED